MFEEIYGIIGVAGTVISVISLWLYVQDARKNKPKIIQTFQHVMDNGEFLIRVFVSNIGHQTAKNCSAKVYLQESQIEDLSFPPIDSPIGRIGADWPKASSFKVHPNTPITLRAYLPSKCEGEKIHIRLYSEGKEVDRSEPFTLTKAKA